MPEDPTILRCPTTRCRAGIGRVDITPPVGIYHRMWGAARHDRAEGVHRSLLATALLIGALDGKESDLNLFVALDHCLLRPPDMDELLRQTSLQTGFPSDRITFAFSHTHSAGHLCRSRAALPGGELIAPYLDSLPANIAAACNEARDTVQPVVVSYALSSASCDLGQNRDYCPPAETTRPDATHLCGLNPRAISSLPVMVARFCDAGGQTVGVLVNYACHPTTLAWGNRLLSPDYVGALRETVEQITGATCLFFLAPSGDIGPKVGFVGDTAIADRTGRQLAFAALSALEALPPPGTDYHFAGPVISGATIAVWEHRAQDESRRAHTARSRQRRWTVPVAYLPGLPTAAEGHRALEDFLARESAARVQGDSAAAAEARALAERQRRLLERIEPLPEGEAYPFPLSVWQMGDAFWIAIEGEPYHALQEDLQRRFPQTPLVFVTIANGIRPSYLPRRVDYDKPWYEVEVALLAPGVLETLTEEIGAQIAAWCADDSDLLDKQNARREAPAP